MIETIYKVFVPAGLMILMFGMGLQLVGGDWLRLLRFPRSVLAGLIGQFILLPLVALLLVYLLSLPLAVAAGVVILAACPGGVVSNSISFLARADLALSVSLTAISSVLALITVPIIVVTGLDLVQQGMSESSHAETISLPLGATFRQLTVLVLLPLSAGMVLRRFAPGFALKSDRWFRVGSVVVLLVLMAGAIALEFDFFLENFSRLWPVLVALNVLTMLGGYLLALGFRLKIDQRRTIAIETGVQNVALGVLVALNLLQQPEWIVVPSVYSIVMMLTAFVLITFFSLSRRYSQGGAAASV